ncbi:cell adhesion molecule CEACAM5-like [Sarcophilus harrisii]
MSSAGTEPPLKGGREAFQSGDLDVDPSSDGYWLRDHASILSCWIQPTSALITVVPNPPYGEVNRSVTLELQGYTAQAVFYTWYRKVVLPSYMIAKYKVETGVQDPAGIREKVFPNGSLLIPHLTLSDTDDYLVAISNSQGFLTVRQCHLAVYERTTKPNLTANKTNVIENDTLAFTCGTEQTGVDILWFLDKKPLILNEKMKLSMNNQTLTILSVKRENTGSYQCEIQNPISFSRSDPFILRVNYGPDSIMFVPNPKKGEIEVKFNNPLMLECCVESYPPAQYIWQLNGTKIPDISNNTYVIKNVNLKNSGKYTCLAKNKVTNLSVSKSITVKVDERTTKPNLTANGTNVIENGTLAFTCGTKEKGVDILWFLDKKPLILNKKMKLSMNNQTLTILSVKRENTGAYQCEIQNPISSSRSDPFILHVNYGPDSIMFVPNPKNGEIEVKFNNPLMLECCVESYPPAQYIWQHNGTKIPDFSNNTYVIKNVTLKNSGKYTCLAKNNVTNLSVSKSITVKVDASILSCWIQPMSAQVTIVPNPPFGKVNRSVTLELQGYTGQAVSYAWFRKAALPGQMIAIYTVTTRVQEPAGIREKVLPNGSLLISNLTLNDTDDYHVTIVNCEGNIIFGQGHLTVYERTTKPNLTANRTNIIENDTMDFTCGTKEKGVDILWFFNKKTLIFNERMKLSIKNRTLTILSVKRENIGSYQCEIRNPISSSRSDPFILHVNYGPDNITFVPKPEKGEIEVKFNDPLMLECHVDSYPPAQYIWQVNGTVNSHFSNNTYIIKSVTWENSENYTCLAKNNVTKLSVSKSITVKVVVWLQSYAIEAVVTEEGTNAKKSQ